MDSSLLEHRPSSYQWILAKTRGSDSTTNTCLYVVLIVTYGSVAPLQGLGPLLRFHVAGVRSVGRLSESE